MMMIYLNAYTLVKRFLIVSITLCLLVLSAVSNPVKASTFETQQRDKSRGKKDDDRQKKEKQEVKEVPKSRRQSKPEPVRKEREEKERPSRSKGRRG
ncbi:hypothetical protein [Pedobacter foliorum]|uniref:hypothetical protein n=1 Tax=Pedobacter foliorum TaxID=2739058 RepID=UPI0015667012|nr:hypothetical protein [Pedobacter foliorum]NRF40659.1 hypothetical protein [Pedobacter foliorum]